MRRLALLGLALILPTTVEAASWTPEEGSALRFEAYQQGAAVEGRFERFDAAIELDPDDLAQARIAVDIDTASIATGHKDRDTILRAPDLLDVARWPSARFASERIEHLGGVDYRALGQLTIRDVQQDVVLPFTLTISDHPGDPGLLQGDAQGELTISRLAFGVGQGQWASTAMVGEEVVIRIEILATAPR
jgi:polyisoprenoid-binding protein YceI